MEDPVDGRLDDGHVVGDHHQAALVAAEKLSEPDDRVGVEVVGRLVQQQGLRTAEQDPGQLDAPALTTRKRAERLAEDALRESDARSDGRGLSLGGVPALVVNSSCRWA